LAGKAIEAGRGYPRPESPTHFEHTLSSRTSAAGIANKEYSHVAMFSGKVAVVTGASSGIGRSTAVGLGAEGARVGVHYRSDQQGAHDTVAAVESAGGSGFILPADFAETGAAQALWSAFDAHADAVDIVVNNAGCPSKGGINAATEAEFDDLFAVNLRTPLFIIQHALPRMADGGRIINVTSIGTQVALPPEVMYLACKGGINSLTRNLAWELGARKITVNAVAPGFTETPMAAPYLSDPGIRTWANSLNALGGTGTPEDVANVIVFLASDHGRWITGQVIDVSGGTVLGVPALEH
jgi:3-oxoacyl-[acyl-carrier protein] reductase